MSDTFTVRDFTDGLVAEFATAVESVLGGTVAMAGAQSVEGDGWLARLTLTGGLRGTLVVWIHGADAAVVAKRVLGMDDEPDAATVADMLREMWTQAASAIGMKSPFTAVKVSLSAPVAGSADVATLGAYALRIAEDAQARLAIWGSASVPPATRAQAPGPATDSNAKLDVVLDIDLPLTVRFGRTSMSLKALTGLGPGSIVDMGRSPDEPVEMLVGEQIIARGEVVIVGGNYGVRITDLVSADERVRALEG